MAENDLEARLTRIHAAARSGDPAARRAWAALIALVLRRDAADDDLSLDPSRLVVPIEERAAEDQEFNHAVQDWLSEYGTVAGGDDVPYEISGTSNVGIVIQGRDFENITFADEMASRPPGPPFGDDDWGDETDDNA